MFEPLYRLSVGSATIDTGEDPTRSTVIWLEVSLDMDTPADQAILHLGRAGGLQPRVGDEIQIELGYRGQENQELVTVFSGEVHDLRPEVASTRLVALSPMTKLLASRVDKTYLSRTAGQVVHDLAGQAGVEVEAVEDGLDFLAYVNNGARNAYQHIRALAEKSGFDVYMTPEGKLVVRRFDRPESTHVLEYGRDVIDLACEQTPDYAGQVEVYGESPADAQGEAAFAWLTKSFTPGTAGSGSARRLVQDASLRTQAGAASAAQAALHRLRQRALTGRVRILGRPQVQLGHAVRISGGPDERMNATFQVRSIRHRLGKRSGFTTDLTFWSLGDEAG